MRRVALAVLALPLLVLAASCGGSEDRSPVPPAGATDTGTPSDSAATRPDALADVPTDVPTDVAADVRIDGGVDASPDVAVDASADVAAEGSIDAGEPDAPPGSDALYIPDTFLDAIPMTDGGFF